MVFWGSEQVAQLAYFGLECDCVEELEKLYVCRVRFEVFFEEYVDAGFEHEGVIDGNHAYFGFLVPAGLAPTRDAAVHHVVGDEEEGLQELG